MMMTAIATAVVVATNVVEKSTASHCCGSRSTVELIVEETELPSTSFA